MKKAVVTLLSCWLLSFLTFSQGPSKYFKQYLEEERALQYNNFHLFQDSKGFIWICGSGGVTRFDSHHFKNASSANTGLASVGNVKVFEDKNRNLWFVGLSGRISGLRGGRFFRYGYNSIVDKYLAWDKCTSVYMDDDETMHFGTFGLGYFQVTKNGEMSFMANKETHEPGVYLNYIEDIPFVFSISKLKEDTTVCIYRLDNGQNPIKLGEVGNLKPGSSLNKTRFIERKDGSVWITQYDKLIRINQSEMDVLNAPFPINFITEDLKGNIWYSNSREKGIWCAPNGDFDDWNHIQHLPNTSVNYMIQDRQKGYWFATESQGLYYSPTFWDVEISLNSDAQPLGTLGELNIPIHDIWFRKGKQDKFYGFTEDGKSYEFTVPGKPDNISEIVCDTHNRRLLICAGNQLFSFDDSGIREIKFTSNNGTVRSVSILSDTSFCVSAGQYLHFFENDSSISVSPECPFEILETLVDGETIYVGTLGSLFKYKNESWSDMRELGRRTIGAIFHMRKFNGDIWLFNTNIGTAYLTPENQLIDFDDAECSLLKGVGNTIVSNGKMQMVGSSGRVFSVVPKSDSSGYHIHMFPSPSYLRNDFIFEIGQFNNQIVFASQDAAYFVSENSSLIAPKIEMTIDEVRINKRPFSPKSTFVLPHDSNAIEIGFVAMSYHSNGPLLYKYYMSGVEPYTEIKKNTVRFTTLPPGNYSFNIYAINAYSQQSEIETIVFKILPPFYLTWWFILMECLFGGICIGALVKFRINQIKGRSRLLEELHTSQHQALAARLSPHFIFNSMSSIHNFTLKNDKEKAGEYMTEYAQLMRLVLENSGQNLVALQNEIEAIIIYLDLERLRCNDKFRYQINISDDVKNLNPPIPSLMLQPYLENAIWHGLMPMEGEDGRLTISVNHEARKTTIEIEDNGIGRAKAQILKTTNHEGFQSVGTDINLKRLELLNKLYKVDFKVNILDLKQGDTSLGTRVVIDVPTIS